MSQATFRFPRVHRQEQVRVTSDSNGTTLVALLRADLRGQLDNLVGPDGVTTLYLQSEAGTTTVTGALPGDGVEATPSAGSSVAPDRLSFLSAATQAIPAATPTPVVLFISNDTNKGTSLALDDEDESIIRTVEAGVYAVSLLLTATVAETNAASNLTVIAYVDRDGSFDQYGGEHHTVMPSDATDFALHVTVTVYSQAGGVIQVSVSQFGNVDQPVNLQGIVQRVA